MVRKWTNILSAAVFLQFAVCGSLAAQNIPFRFKSVAKSDRDLLKLGKPLDRLAKLSENRFETQSGPDTLRILAIRVDFQEDNNTLTTGNGKFDLSTTNEVFIDPPPHDLKYFEHQLLALSNYYRTVSHGRLILLFDVFPKAPNDSYTVSEQMSSYTPTTSEEDLDRRISELFREGFQLADATDAIDFSAYDSFILFHAGVGSDFAFDFDPTPQDVPSVFLSFKDLQKNLGNSDPQYPGIAVNNGAFFIRDGIILPETQSQEDLEIALLGTMAIMFGNQLGLPILFNPDNGRSGIGVFGLMDQGSGNFTGLIPAEPCAWSKIYLGWEAPVVVRNGEDLPVAAPAAQNPNRIYKIPINANEYFLIENRDRDLNGDNITVGQDAQGTRVEFVWDDQGQRVLAEAVPGVITQVSEYDFGLPGSGILIWHVDENVIAANFAANRVNADPNHRGVDLEEADGAQDIGQFYGFLSPGSGAENGVLEDMFWASNEINMLVNNQSPVVEFTPLTTPDSRANSGADSHIYITDFSEPDSIMRFSVREDISFPAFPRFANVASPSNSSPLAADLDGDGEKEVVLASGNQLLAWHLDGSKVIANDDAVSLTTLNGTQKSYPLAVFAQPRGAKVFPPAIAFLQDDKIVIAATDEGVSAYKSADENADGRADVLFELSSDEAISTAPFILEMDSQDFQVFVGTEAGTVLQIATDGSLLTTVPVASSAIEGLAVSADNSVAFAAHGGQIGVLSQQGSVLWQSQISGTYSKAPVIADLDQNGETDVISVSNEGEIVVLDATGQPLRGFPQETRLNPTSEIAVGDIDHDGFLNIVFVAGNRLVAYNHFGALDTNFPIALAKNSSAELAFTSAPVLVDLNGDAKLEMLLGSLQQQVLAFNLKGQQVDGFPLSTGAAVSTTLFADDLQADGTLDLLVTAEDGFLYAWDSSLPVTAASIVWGGLYKDVTHSNANTQVLQPVAPEGKLMPVTSVYNYPNPTEGNQTTIRYRLNSPAQVKIKIYDLVGEFVDELDGTGFSPAENEVSWDLDNIQSGVYLAHIEAVGSSGKDVAIIKIAVVK